MFIIGICGPKGSGKSTLSDYLCQHHEFIEYAFAKPLKQGIQCMFGLTDDQLYDPDKKEEIDPVWGVTPRQLFQVIGTELLRKQLPELLPTFHSGDGLWIQMFHKFMKLHSSKRVVVSDVRFQKEAMAIRNLGGLLVYVERPGLQLEHDQHTSEQEWRRITYDVRVKNDGSIQELGQQTVTILKKYLIGD